MTNKSDNPREKLYRKVLHGRWVKIVSAMASVVVFVTVYALILPAITLSNQEPKCSLEEHTHVAECYDAEGNIVCGSEEHVHNLACYSDLNAAIENEEYWAAELPELTGDRNADVIAVAKSQIGYKENEDNYIVSENDQMKGYTRYGHWFGDTVDTTTEKLSNGLSDYAYKDWDAMFVSFVLRYAEIYDLGFDSDAGNWAGALSDAAIYVNAADYAPQMGDLIFFTPNVGDNMRVGIVSGVNRGLFGNEIKSISVILGDSNNTVEEVKVAVSEYTEGDITFETIHGYGVLTPGYGEQEAAVEPEVTAENADAAVVAEEDVPEETAVVAPEGEAVADASVAEEIEVAEDAPVNLEESAKHLIGKAEENLETVEEVTEGEASVTLLDSGNSEDGSEIVMDWNVTAHLPETVLSAGSIIRIDTSTAKTHVMTVGQVQDWAQAAGVGADNTSYVNNDNFEVTFIGDNGLLYSWDDVQNMDSAAVTSFTGIHIKALNDVALAEDGNVFFDFASTAKVADANVGKNYYVSKVTVNGVSGAETYVYTNGEAQTVDQNAILRDAGLEEQSVEKTLIAKKNDYTVTMTYGSDAKIPDGAKLYVKEIKQGTDKYNQYIEHARTALRISDEDDADLFGRFFDIKIITKDGEFEPKAPVNVKVEYKKAIETHDSSNVNAVHFSEDGPETIQVETVDVSESDDEMSLVKSVEFSAESFSVYGVVYTIDFATIDGGTYSIPGEDSYKLSEMLPFIIGKSGEISSANLELIEGDEVEGALYLTKDEEGEYWINSETAFDETYLLTVVVDGAKYLIKVTDAGEADLVSVMGNAVNQDERFKITSTSSLDNVARDGSASFHLMYDVNSYSQLETLKQTSATRNGRDTYCWYVDMNAESIGSLATAANESSGYLRDSSGQFTVGEYQFVDDRIYFYLYKERLSAGEQVALGRDTSNLTVNVDFNIQMDADKIKDSDSTTLDFPGTSDPTINYKPYEYKNATKSRDGFNQETVVKDSDFDSNDNLTFPWVINLPAQDVDMNTLVFSDTMTNGLVLDKSSVKITYKVPNGTEQTITVPQSSITGSDSNFSFDARAAMGLNPIPAGTVITVKYDSKLPKNQVSGAPGANGVQEWKNNTANWTINGHNSDVPPQNIKVTYKSTSIQNGSKSGDVLNRTGDYVTEASKDENGNYHIKYTLTVTEPIDVSELSVKDTPDSRVHIDYSTFQMKVGDSGTAFPISATQGTDGSFTIDIDSKFPDGQKVNSKIPADSKIIITYEATISSADVVGTMGLVNTAKYTVEGQNQPDVPNTVWIKENPEKGSKEMTRGSTQVFEGDIDAQGYFEIPYEASVVTNYSYNTQLEYIDKLSNNHTLKDGSVTVTIGGHTYNVNSSDSSQIIKNGQTFTVDIDRVLTANGGSLPVPAGTEIKVNYITRAKASDVVDKPGVTVSNESDWKFDNKSREGQDISTEFTGPMDDHIAKHYTSEVNENNEVEYTFEVVVGNGTYPLDGHTVTDTASRTLDWVSGFTVTSEEGHAVLDSSLIRKTWVDPQDIYNTQEVFSLTFPKEGDVGYNGPYYGPYVITYKMKSANDRIKAANKKDFVVSNSATHQKNTKRVEFTENLPSDDVSLEKKFSKWDLDNKKTYWTIQINPPAKGSNYQFNLYEDGNSSHWGKSENNMNEQNGILWEEATAVYKNDPSVPFTNFYVGNQWSQKNCLTFPEGALTEPILVTLPVELRNLNGGGFDIWVENTAKIYKETSTNNFEEIDNSTDTAHKENYYPQASVNKTVLETNSNTHEVTWKIVVNQEKNTYPEGTYITITDTIPEGMTWSENYRYSKPNRLWFTADGKHGYQNNDGIEPTTNNVDSVKGGGTFTVDLATVNGGIDLDGTQIIIEYVTKLVDGEFDNLINVGVKSYTNKVHVTDGSELIDNGDEATETFGYDALEKKEQTGTGLSGGNVTLSADVIDYEIVINSEGKELNSGKSLILTDVIATNVELDVYKIKVYKETDTPANEVTHSADVEISYIDDSRTLTVKVPDRKKYILKFSVHATSTGATAQHFSNTASLQGHGYWEDTYECDHIVRQHEGSAVGTEAKITLFKIDGNNVLQPLSGAKFKFYKCTLDENGKIIDSVPVTDVHGNEYAITDTDGLGDWYVPDATGNVNKTVFYFIETEPSDPTYAIGEYAQPHYFIMYSGERGGEGYQAADVIDRKVSEVNGVIVNKVSYGYSWRVTNRNHMDYTASKVWKDDEDDISQRPDYIWLRLLRDGQTCPASEDLVNPIKVTPRVDGRWTHTWENLPMVDPDDHHEYTYSVVEDQEKKDDNDYTEEVLQKLHKYVMTVSGNVITNRKIKEGNLHILKKWDDNNNANFKRPTSITLSISRYTDDSNDKEVVKTVTLSPSDNWSKDVYNLEVEDNTGHKYTYVVEEAEIEDYVAEPSNIIQVDNTWTVEFTNVEHSSTEYEATKTWVNTDETKLQNAQVKFNLYREIEGVRDPGFGNEATLTISDKVGEDITTWKKVWPELPSTGSFTYTPAGGDELTKTGTFTYRVEETKVIYDNEESTISNNVDSTNKWIIAQDGGAITNTLNETEFSIKKVWLDSNSDGQKQTWPEDVTIGVTLYRNATYTNTDNQPCAVPEEVVGIYDIPVNGLPDNKISVTLDSTNTWYVINFTELAEKVPASLLTNPSSDVKWTYYVKETAIPDGYSMQYGSADGVADNSKSSAGEDEAIINSLIEVTLPETGGMGTMTYRVAGLLLVVIAFVSIYLNKKRGRWCDGC